MGRPSKYKPEICKKMVEFFDRPLTIKVGNKIEPNLLPTFQRFCAENKFHVDTLHEWVRKYPEFSEAYTICKYFQYDFLLQNGLNGRFSGSFACLTAKNVIGFRDKNEHDIKLQGVDANEDDVIEFLAVDDKKIH